MLTDVSVCTALTVTLCPPLRGSLNVRTEVPELDALVTVKTVLPVFGTTVTPFAATTAVLLLLTNVNGPA